MKTIKLTATLLGALVMLCSASNTLDAAQKRAHDVIAIEIEKAPPQDIRRVQVEGLEREPQRVPVQEREDREEPEMKRVEHCKCSACQRRLINKTRPVYHGRVPVGQSVGRYGQGVVIHPAGRTPEKVVVVPPAPRCHCHDHYSFSWQISCHR